MSATVFSAAATVTAARASHSAACADNSATSAAALATSTGPGSGATTTISFTMKFHPAHGFNRSKAPLD